VTDIPHLLTPSRQEPCLMVTGEPDDWTEGAHGA